MIELHILRRALSALVAFLLGAVGLLLAVEAGNRLGGRDQPAVVDYPPVLDDLSDRPWSDDAVRWSAVLAVLLGLLLLYAAVRRATQPLMMQSNGDVRCEIPRNEVERLLSLAAERVSGVGSSRVKVGRNTAKVTATTRAREPGDLPRDVQSACQERLDALMLEQPLKTKVRIEAGRR